jgi:hypothetical protein
MRDTNCVCVLGGVFCKTAASISSTPNLLKCAANDFRKRLIHSLLQMSAYSPSAVATPKDPLLQPFQRHLSKRELVFLSLNCSQLCRQFRIDCGIALTFRENNPAVERKRRELGRSRRDHRSGSRTFHPVQQLFNAIDPSPFRDKDLDPKVEEFIVGWAKVQPVTQRLLWWWISTGRPGYPTRLLCYATRFTSSSVNELKHMGGVCANCSLWAGPAL